MELDTVASLRCSNCGSDHVYAGRVRSAFWHDERLVVVDDIPAMVCAGCGEQFYEDSTAIGLDLMRGAGFPSERAREQVCVPVFSFADVAPYTGGS